MRILIIEDEQSSADRLKRLVNEIDSKHEIAGILRSNAEIQAFLNDAPSVDLILADIQLGDGLSFESLKSAPHDIPIVFTTAYDHYAVQAFKYNSIDYLLKPIDIKELSAVLNKVQSLLHKEALISSASLNQMLTSANQPSSYRERFLIPHHKEEYLVIPVCDVSLIGIDDGVVCIFTKSGVLYPINMTLDELTKQLDPAQFMRVNRQFIVHATDVQKLSSLFFGKVCVHIKSYPALTIVVSKDKAASVKRWLGA